MTEPPSRIKLDPAVREKLAALAGLEVEAAMADLDHLQTILNDHAFITGVFDHPKPNAVRDLIAPKKGMGLQAQGEALAETLRKVTWQVSAEYKVHGFNLITFREELERFLSTSETVLSAYAGQTTPRRPPMGVRDRHTIPAIFDLFDRMSGHEAGGERDWEHMDDLCGFVALALESAGIPYPAAGDTRQGEEYQGRLRRLLKQLVEQRYLAQRPQDPA